MTTERNPMPATTTTDICRGCDGDGGKWVLTQTMERDRRYKHPVGPCEACGGDGEWNPERQADLARAMSQRMCAGERGVPFAIWRAIKGALTPEQEERIKGKAKWEGVTWLGVLRDWPTLFIEQPEVVA